MIEIEKKFQPTKGALHALLSEAEFLDEKRNMDIYYDYPDFRLFKNGFRLRERNGNLELKIKKDDFPDSGTTNSEEIDTEGEILERLGMSKDSKLREILEKDMKAYASWETKRRKYKNGRFIIDVDETSFGYNVCEIEVMVEDPLEARQAEEEIVKLAGKFAFSLAKLPSKMKEYLRVVKPALYSELGKYV
jgi:predicted adenylyl cyclase CyaB